MMELPALRTRREARRYTALYSNAARAHRLGATRGWVMVYGEVAGERQNTVVTARTGSLRGREAECAEFYASQQDVAPA
jgi:hypothetical protein